MVENTLSLVKKIIHVTIPFPLLIEKYLSRVLEEKLSIEVGFDHGTFDHYRAKDLRFVAKKLQKAGISCTVHAPFCDLSPAAFDRLIQKASLKRLEQALKAARYFEPKVVVFHSGYHPGYHRDRVSEWQSLAIEAIESLLEKAIGYNLRLAIENVFEPNPEILKNIVEKIDSEILGYCFDPGHSLAFAKSNWQPWLEAFYTRIFELHIHDNNGDWDDHLCPGEGKIPFLEIFKFLSTHCLRPVFTLEAHREEDVLFWHMFLCLEL